MHDSLKLQIEYAIKTNTKNNQTLFEMLELYTKLAPNGWTPAIYDQCITELYRVQMCVVHRSLIFDLLLMCDEIDPSTLPNYRFDSDGDEIDSLTTNQYERIREALSAALKGLPPKR